MVDEESLDSTGSQDFAARKCSAAAGAEAKLQMIGMKKCFPIHTATPHVPARTTPSDRRLTPCVSALEVARANAPMLDEEVWAMLDEKVWAIAFVV